ncbi:MAG: efflux RND transporter periplasmic adaptor subunit [Gemmataceae bacterium]
MRRLLTWVFILGLLGGAGYAVTGPGMAWWRQQIKPRYVTAQVSRGRIESAVNSTGTIKPVRTVLVGSFVSGPILEVKVDFNSTVTKDQVLAIIDDRLLRAAYERDTATLATQEAERNRVQALLDQAVRNEERAIRLRKINKDYVSDTEMDQFTFNRKSLEAQVKLATASIQQAEANRKNSKANLDYCKILSPVDGIVIERKVDPGQTVAASFQTPELFTVAPNMDKEMHIYASVDEADIGLIEGAQANKMPVQFTVDAYPHDLFEGTIYQIRRNSTTNQNVVTYPVVVRTTNPRLKLLPGMTANLSFLVETKENLLRVPAAALRFAPPLLQVHPEDRALLTVTPEKNNQDSGSRISAGQKAALARGRSQRVVWVKDGEWLRGKKITLGVTDTQFAELIEGNIAEGEELITGLDSTPR